MLAGQPDFSEQIAQELQLTPVQVDAALQLFTAGGTVPFVARYRKEATGGLDEVQLRTLLERNVYLHELEQRRQSVLSSISEQGKLTDLLKKTILECTSKSVLEDLYLPYKPKRRTKATIAKDRGLEPLAELLWKQCGSDSLRISPCRLWTQKRVSVR
ncbi:MAG: Tex-like N-terminal domain-containing protein [Myxococcota bacterium]